MNYLNEKPRKGYGFIYKYTSPSGKSYVGQTINSLAVRCQNGLGYENCTVFFSAIKKYKIENFSVEILEECEIEILDEKENFYIEKFNTLVPNGYNIKMDEKSNYVGRKRKTTSIYQFDCDGNFVKKYDSLADAARENNCHYQTISTVANGHRSQHKGYIYKYDSVPPEKVIPQKTQGRKTAKLDAEGNILEIYPSAAAAARALGKPSSSGRNIRAVCSGERNMAYGYSWKYLE